MCNKLQLYLYVLGVARWERKLLFIFCQLFCNKSKFSGKCWFWTCITSQIHWVCALSCSAFNDERWFSTWTHELCLHNMKLILPSTLTILLINNFQFSCTFFIFHSNIFIFILLCRKFVCWENSNCGKLVAKKMLFIRAIYAEFWILCLSAVQKCLEQLLLRIYHLNVQFGIKWI